MTKFSYNNHNTILYFDVTHIQIHICIYHVDHMYCSNNLLNLIANDRAMKLSG